MLVNKANLNEIYRNLNASFQRAFEAAPMQWKKIAMLVPSSSSRNDYSWVQYFPRMREWIGEKVIKSLAGQNYVIDNRDWEATIEVDRNDIEDDQLGIYRPQAEGAGYSAAQLPDEIVFELLNDGFANKCYDGKAFFATDHPVGDSTVSNKGTKALGIATLEAAIESYGAARIALLGMKDDEKRPLNVMPNMLVVPPNLEAEARVIVKNMNLADSGGNPYRDTAEVVVDPRLTSATAWFLLDTSKPMGALIYQERTKPRFVQQTDMGAGAVADSVFERRKFRYSVECRAAGGYGFWQLAYGSDGTA